MPSEVVIYDAFCSGCGKKLTFLNTAKDGQVLVCDSPRCQHRGHEVRPPRLPVAPVVDRPYVMALPEVTHAQAPEVSTRGMKRGRR